MEGGELQIVKAQKDEAYALIEATEDNIPADRLQTVSYEKSGACILVQGSEMVHRVTAVKKSKEPRLSLIMTLQPASPFQPDKTALDTLKRFDDVDGTAPFEFFRLKAQNMGSALQLLAA